MTGKLKPYLLSACAGLALTAALLLAAGEPKAAAPAVSPNAPAIASPNEDYSHLPRTDSHCAGGCSAAAPTKEALGAARIAQLLGALSSQPAGTPSPEFDQLLFAGNEAAAFLEQGNHPLDPAWTRFLEKELARQEVRLQVRVKGEDGTMGIRVDTVVRLGKRTHVAPDHTRGLTPPEVTLTVRRVGLGHLWTRL